MRARQYAACALFLLVFIIPGVFFGVSSFIHPHVAFAETTEEKEARLRSELSKIEAEQAETQKILDGARSQSASLQRDVTILNAEIKKAQLNIQAKNIAIQKLGKDIDLKEKTIGTLEERIERGQRALAQMLRKTYELDSYSIPEALLAQQDMAHFFEDLDNFNAIHKSLQTTFIEIRDVKAQTETERNTLDKKKDSETDARFAIEQEKKKTEQFEAQKKALLGISKNSEKAYEQVLAAKRKKAAEIRAALFALRDVAPIPFDQALKFANLASEKTGIRPAFLLAILTQESSLGKNVGSCYLTNGSTGEGVSAKTGTVFPNVMKPGRDVEPFISITKELGLDPYKTLVSCPQSIGYGGAMGPAQFIASTWVLFKNRLSTMLGKKTPNPWEPLDAFLASATYLTDLGAINGSYTGERNAACRYYSGKACGTGINATYGNQVMYKAQTIQETMINPLQGL